MQEHALPLLRLLGEAGRLGREGAGCVAVGGIRGVEMVYEAGSRTRINLGLTPPNAGTRISVSMCIIM